MGRYQVIGEKVVCSQTEIPVVWQGDVLVAGGGPAGLGSAIAAARNGARTLLIEQHGFLGGMCAYGSGMPLGGAYPAHRSIGGIAEEILTAIRSAGPEAASVRDIPHFGLWYYHDYEYFKVLAFELVEQAGVEVLLHAFVSDVIQDGDRVLGLVIESKSGREAVLASAIVDCTGDADVAAKAGADFVKGDPSGAMMAGTISYILADVDAERVIRYREEEDPKFERAKARARADGYEVSPEDDVHRVHVGMRPRTLFCNNIRVRDVDGTDVRSLTRAEMAARKRIMQHVRFFRRYIPGCEQAYVVHSGEQIGIRDTRRIVGEATLTTEACLELQKRPDVILRCGGPLDDVARKQHPTAVTPMKSYEDWYDIPYGCLVPRGLANVLVAGRSFSASHLAQAGSRGQALLIGMGQAAGTAATLVARQGVRAKDVDVKELQGILKAQGADLGI